MKPTGPGTEDDLGVWVAQVLETLCDAQAWFRHGLTAQEISERSDLPLRQVFAACRLASSEGYVEVADRPSTKGLVFSLTPIGVAVACHADQEPLLRKSAKSPSGEPTEASTIVSLGEAGPT